MSHWEQESGVLQLSASSLRKFRIELTKAYNAHQKEKLDAALKAHLMLADIPASERKVLLKDSIALLQFVYEKSFRKGVYWGAYQEYSPFVDDDLWEMVSSLRRDDKQPQKLYKPRKSDFPLLPLAKAGLSLNAGGGQIWIEGKSLFWQIAKNNRNVQQAYERPLFQKLAELRNDHQYGRNEGGNSAYLCESCGDSWDEAYNTPEMTYWGNQQRQFR